jgi:hypothetical protein
MVEFEDYNGIDIAIQDFDVPSEWVVYADEKLVGGEHTPYKERVETLDEAKERAMEIKGEPHPEKDSKPLDYVEISEVKK